MQPRPPSGGPPQAPGFPPGYSPYQYPPGTAYPVGNPQSYPRMMPPPPGYHMMSHLPLPMQMNPYAVGLPVHGMPPMHMMSGGMPAGYPPQAPLLQHLSTSTAATPPAPQVIIGAPVLRTSVISAPPAFSSTAAVSANNINLFNNSNANCVFVNPTSDILNRTIFGNAMAGLPLTVYCGKIPSDLEDSKLAKMFECCGKITQYAHPVDPVSSRPATFAFVTFNQAICALRAVNIINDLDVMNGRGDKLVVKAGSKESLAIRSVQQTESDATASLPEGHSLEDVYGPIRKAIGRILQPVVVEASEEQKKEAAEAVTKALNSDANTEDSLLQRPVSYYESLLAMNASHADKAVNSELSTKGQPIYEPMPREAGEATDGDEEEVPEVFLQSEIDRFRQRQAIREKEIAETKKNRILARLRQIEAAQQRDQQRETAEGVTIAKPKPPPLPPSSSSSHKRLLEGEEELEAKRQRKLQVLQMLSDSGSSALPPASASDAVSSRGFKLATTVNKGVRAASTWEEEDEDKAKSKMHLLEEGEEDDGAATSAGMQVQEEDEDYGDLAEQDEGVKGARKNRSKLMVPKTKLPAVVPGLPQNVQQKVLAQAQAISAALSGKQQPAALQPVKQQASSAPIDPKEALRQLVLRIPTEPTALLAQPVHWSLLTTHRIVETQLKDWIDQKVVEYLGEGSSSLRNFIVQKLSHDDGCSPQELRQELAMVLDEDAEGFVLKLWRMLVFYSLKCEQGL